MRKKIKKGYTKVNVRWGYDLEDTVNDLINANKNGIKCYVDFNGHILYSDTVTTDNAFLEVTGMTKAESDADRCRH